MAKIWVFHGLPVPVYHIPPFCAKVAEIWREESIAMKLGIPETGLGLILHKSGLVVLPTFLICGEPSE